MNCSKRDWAGTDLIPVEDSGYVVTYRSDLGITVSGEIRVDAWLNGTAASQSMELMTQSSAGLAFGTGSTEYNGSFDGWIASVVIYNRALSEDERILVENCLKDRYGLQ